MVLRSVGSGVVAVWLVACAPGERGSSGAAQQQRNLRGSVVYVDQAASPGGDGSRQAAFDSVEAGVYAACDLPAPRTVLVAAGVYEPLEDGYDEKNIFVRCPMTIHGATRLSHDAGLLPTGLDPRHAPTILRPDLSEDGDAAFRVISSDVTIEGFAFERSGSAGFVSAVEVGGFPQADDPDRECPTDTVRGVKVRGSTTDNSGAGILSYDADVQISDLYETHNITGFVLLGGPEEADVTSVVAYVRSESNAFGGCVFSNDIGFAANCLADPSDPRPMTHTSLIVASDFSGNYWAGLRQSALAVPDPQPDALGRLDLWAVGDTFTGGNYGVIVDIGMHSQGVVRTGPTYQHGVYLDDDFGDNTRNDVFVTFKHFAASLFSWWGHEEDYAVNTTLAIDITPGVLPARVDRDIPSSDDDHDAAYLNGEQLTGTSISPQQ